MNSTLLKLSSGFLTAALVVIVPVTAAAASSTLETDAVQVNTQIEEWHWRDMSH